ncbi:hypothetical protein GN958_ATG07010 [Phytophthora infestans]|uniref:SAP domain-containing protein n=1 Tax=Phytophthora infestans TaxID=4787 RepID=A0A8S9USV3_PHYIN|nr:hypothetical protein GN958_ATG07010 [Phytophthora infestans]
MQGDKDVDASAADANALRVVEGATQTATTNPSESNSRSESVVSALWTVADPGKTTPPISDDYSLWTVEQLQKECKSRKLRLGRKTSVADRVKHLCEFDALHRSMISATLASADGVSVPSNNCTIRLLHVLFSDIFAPRFARIGDKPSRQQLDAGETHGISSFWRDVASEFNPNRTDYSDLFTSDARFEGVDASVVVIHSATKVYDMWKDVNKRYLKAMANFTKSGEHEDDFFTYCEGALDTFYLRECLKHKRDLASFVDGGLFAKDQFDSLKRGRSDSSGKKPPQQVGTKKQRSEVAESVIALAAAIAPARPSTAERLMSLHKLIQQVETRMEKLQQTGESDESLQRSLDLYRMKLLKLEEAFFDEV